MPSANNVSLPGNNDTRWFIWAIVFLVATGISLVSYIVLSDSTGSDVSAVSMVHSAAAAKIPARK